MYALALLVDPLYFFLLDILAHRCGELKFRGDSALARNHIFFHTLCLSYLSVSVWEMERMNIITWILYVHVHCPVWHQIAKISHGHKKWRLNSIKPQICMLNVVFMLPNKKEMPIYHLPILSTINSFLSRFFFHCCTLQFFFFQHQISGLCRYSSFCTRFNDSLYWAWYGINWKIFVWYIFFLVRNLLWQNKEEWVSIKKYWKKIYPSILGHISSFCGKRTRDGFWWFLVNKSNFVHPFDLWNNSMALGPH